MRDFRASIPGWLDAVEEEQRLHEDAFAFPYVGIARFPVRHLTLLDLCRLSSQGNRFAHGDFPDFEEFKSEGWTIDAAELIAYLHIDYDPQKVRLNKRRKRKVRRSNKVQLYDELKYYFDQTFADKIADTKQKKSYEVRHWSGIVDYIDVLATEYGWTDDHIMSIPYRRVIQYVRKIAKRNNPKIPLPDKAADIVTRHLYEKSQKKEGNK